ncbi:MAG: alpha-L-rhamnosidase [Bacteroidales bacterium]|nr:alpha-L-rhamnosidase [Bacteroidales bacterium]
MKTNKFLIFILVNTLTLSLFAQFPPVFVNEEVTDIKKDPLSRFYLTPQRIVWISSDSLVSNSDILLENGNSQAFFGKQKICKIQNRGNERSGILLDFGTEIHGGIQITTSQSNNVTRRVRLRFGESVSEACGELHDKPSGYGGGIATNHHAMRDFVFTLPGYGTINVGNTGFRFVRIDLVDPDVYLALKEVRAVAVIRDIPYLGSFRCNDERLNRIWETGAYTVHLCMQDYLWDGIKRDRMVWAGDMHPEVMTISSVFGYNEVVPKTLDFLRETTPLPGFMNGIPSYSMWWVMMQYDWYIYHGDLDYLHKNKEYILELLELLIQYVGEDGKENLHNAGFRFIDWPSVHNKEAVHAGLQALMALTFDRGAKLCGYLDEGDKARQYQKMAGKVRDYKPDANQSKQAAALLAISGIIDAQKADKEIISVGGPKNFSTFFGYYMLQGQALAGNFNGALDNIRQYWGGMLDLGATTFWEDFNLDEAKNAAPVIDFIPEGKLDYHRETGAECYIGLRRSLCHGWASGPTIWLSEHVLGVKVLEPGCKKVSINPHPGDLEWVEGTFPTPLGVIKISHKKMPDGEIETKVDAPEGIEIIR